MDLGRIPEARYPHGALADLGEEPVTEADLAYVVERIGLFGDDNRAGIGLTLHRISAIRNRRGEIVGLTCRVGRAVRGTVTLIQDVVEAGRSLLILGRPGVGKTTLSCVRRRAWQAMKLGQAAGWWWWIPPMRSRETATCRIRALAGPDGCRWRVRRSSIE